MSKSVFRLALVATALTTPAFAQAQESPASPPPIVAGSQPMPQSDPSQPAPAESTADPNAHGRPFRFGGEIKFGVRNSRDVEYLTEFPYPPGALPPGQTEVFERTVSPGTSMEVQNLALIGEGELTHGVTAKIEVHFLDLYNRNPTSSDDRVFVRQAWVRVGRDFDPLEAVSGSSAYVLVGMAPRFTKPKSRRLDSYGLWTTAVGRFENPQLQSGGTIGQHVYWRASAGNGNPLFMRDPNALAGDNGTPETKPGSGLFPIYQSGFPILYDAKAQDLNPSGKFEYGLGAGYRTASDAWALDVLGWYFHRDLVDGARIRGTYYRGDIKMLKGVKFPLPYSGRDKMERGVTVDARAGHLRIWGEYVDQEIANLPRRGYEVETAYRIPMSGWFLIGETVVGQWIQPVVRVSYIDNRFGGPDEYPAPSVLWDWKKVDFGLRVGLTSNVDVTVEYNWNSALTEYSALHPNETVTTIRIGF